MSSVTSCLLILNLFYITGDAMLFKNFKCSDDEKVTLSPSDPCLYATQSISLNCSSDLDPGQLQFYVGNEMKPKEQVQILDNRTASITIKHADMSLNELNIVCKNRDSQQFGCSDSQMLRVFELPENVSNVTCVVEDWTSSMICSWHLRKNYHFTPNITFMWRISGYGCKWTPCPNYVHNSCVWRSTADGDFSMKSIDIAVTAGPRVNRRCLDKSTTTYRKINTKTVVKPSAVNVFESRVINSTCVQLTWKPNRKEYEKLYNITCTSKWDDRQVKLLEDTDARMVDSAMFCNLAPYTIYDFSVHVKPGKRYWSADGNEFSACVNSSCTNGNRSYCIHSTGYWSDEKSTTATTYTSAPNAAPSMTAGGYMWSPSDCEQRMGNRNVYIYWKPLDEKYKNGPLISYDVTIQSIDGDLTQTYYRSEDVTFDQQVLRCDTGYNVSVQARNINGTSPSSSITILPLRKDISPPNVIVEMSNDTNDEDHRTVDVTWSNMTEQHEVVGFTVYTCRHDGGKCDPNSALNWQSVSKDTSSLTFNLPRPDLYVYGVSVETIEGSSGFNGQSCVFTKHTAPTGPPEHVEVHAENGDSNLLVTWDKLTCKPGRPIIMKYIVRFCVTDMPMTSCKDKEVSGETSSVVLQELEEEQLYDVQVQAVAKSGLLGHWSDIVQKKTNKVSDASMLKIALGSVGSVILLAVVVLVCFLCWRKKKKLEKSNQVDMPGSFIKILEHSTHTPPPPMRQPSDESGYEDGFFEEDETESEWHSADDTVNDKTYSLVQNSKHIHTPDGYVKISMGSSGQYIENTTMVVNPTSKPILSYTGITVNKNSFTVIVDCKTSFQNLESFSKLTHKDIHLKEGVYNDGFISDSLDKNKYNRIVMNKDTVSAWLSSSDIPKSIEYSLVSNPDHHRVQKDCDGHMKYSSGSKITMNSAGDYAVQSIIITHSNDTETCNVNNSEGVQSISENTNHNFHKTEPEKHFCSNSRELDIGEDTVDRQYKDICEDRIGRESNSKQFTSDYVSTNYMESTNHDQESKLVAKIKQTEPISYKKQRQPISYKKETGSLSYKKETGPMSYKKETGLMSYKKETWPMTYKKKIKLLTYKKEIEPMQALSGSSTNHLSELDDGGPSCYVTGQAQPMNLISSGQCYVSLNQITDTSSSSIQNISETTQTNNFGSDTKTDDFVPTIPLQKSNNVSEQFMETVNPAAPETKNSTDKATNSDCRSEAYLNSESCSLDEREIDPTWDLVAQGLIVISAEGSATRSGANGNYVSVDFARGVAL